MKREVVEDRVTGAGQSGPSGILALLGEPTEDKPVLKEHCKAVWERNAEVKILLLLNRMGAYTENAKKNCIRNDSRFQDPAT